MECMRYPRKPTNSQDIWNYAGDGERLACSLVGKFDLMQRCAFRKLREMMGEQRFREVLCEAVDILSRPNSIEQPAGWLYWFLASEVK